MHLPNGNIADLPDAVWRELYEEATKQCERGFGYSDAWSTKSFRRQMIYHRMAKILRERETREEE